MIGTGGADSGRTGTAVGGIEAGLEPLREQHGQVVLDQALQLVGAGEALVRDVVLVLDPVEELRRAAASRSGAGCLM